MGLIKLDLKLAFQEEGCPVCRLRHQSEQRYIYNLLWENVTDGGIRAMLVRSLGFCHAHSWQLQETEQKQWNDGLGTGIIYEDLTERALAGLKAYTQEVSRSPARNMAPRWWKRLRRLWPSQPHGAHDSGPANNDFLPASLVPRGPCRVCELGDRTEATYLSWLLRSLSDDDFQEAYRTSDGLCLPHLRQALALARDENPDTLPTLTEIAEEKTRRLAHALGEYVQTQLAIPKRDGIPRRTIFVAPCRGLLCRREETEKSRKFQKFDF
ncbi:MAG: hypothetical protein GXP41_01555 [Chloroflexi bacterium]|nr:hypothetical protein [Chloroflexota bacterium]